MGSVDKLPFRVRGLCYLRLMAFQVRAEVLREGIARVLPLVPSRSLYPITQNILFYQQGEDLEVRATDLEISLRTWVRVLPEAGDGVRLVLPPKVLLDLVKGFSGDEVLTFRQKEYHLEVSSRYGHYEFSGMAPEEFPAFPARPDKEGVRIPFSRFIQVVEQTAFAASKEDSRLALTGIYFDFEEMETNFVATDAHTLVRLTLKDLRLPGAPKLLIPVKALGSLQQAIKGLPESDELTLYPSEGQAFFHHPLVEMVCRLIDARFPDYRAVIPSSPPYVARLSTEAFQRTLKRLSVLANKKMGFIRLEFVGNTLTARVEDPEGGLRGEEYLPCEYEGPDFQIAFRSSILEGVLEHLQAPHFLMRMEAPGRAARLEPDPQSPQEEALFLVMPMML